jgi:hypothetical protein
MTIMPPIPSTQMGTDSSLRCAGVGIVTVIQNHRLNIAEDGFDWIVIRTPFGQRNPMQPQRPHRLLGLPRFAGMRPVLIESNPDVVARIPAAHTPHELTDLVGAFAWQERPVGTPTVDLIEKEEIELSPCLLLTS